MALPYIENLYRSRLPVEMPGGYAFDHFRTLRRIDLYYNSQYETGPFDSKGYRKFFYNICKPAVAIAQKFVDLDTRDVNLVPDHPDHEYLVWLMQRDLRQWMKQTGFGVLLNEISLDYPKYGTVIVKKAGEKLLRVNLHNLRYDPSSASLEMSPFVYELHLMTAEELKKHAKDKKWNSENLEQLLKEGMNKDGLYEIWECYDYSPDGEKPWARTIRGDLFRYKGKGGAFLRGTEAMINLQTDYLPALELAVDYVDSLPYRELHWEKIPGRHLGVGFVEDLFENQIAENEAENLERKALYFKALQAWYSPDEMIGRNLLTDVDFGEIIKTQAQIYPLQKDSSDTAAFNFTRSRWAKNAEQKTFSFDIARGENLPSRTPLGVANLSAGMVASYFELKRENFGLFVRDLILNDVIPSFKEKKRGRHILMLPSSDKEIERFKKAYAEAFIWERVKDYVDKHGWYPDGGTVVQKLNLLQDELLSRKNIAVEIPENFYEDAKYHVDVIVTGEQVDTGARIQTIQTALQIISANPAILQNPITRSVFFKLLALAGVSPVDLGLMEEMSKERQMLEMPELPQGGSVSVPTIPQGTATLPTSVEV